MAKDPKNSRNPEIQKLEIQKFSFVSKFEKPLQQMWGQETRWLWLPQQLLWRLQLWQWVLQRLRLLRWQEWGDNTKWVGSILFKCGNWPSFWLLRRQEEDIFATKIVRGAVHQCWAVSLRAWTKSRLLLCCINVYVHVRRSDSRLNFG